jgi:hypothetical protein
MSQVIESALGQPQAGSVGSYRAECHYAHDSGRWGIPIRPTFAYVGSASSVIWDRGEEID